MRILSVMIFCLGFISTTSYAAVCQKWEYLKLKESTRSELNEEYCFAKSMAVSFGELAVSSGNLVREMRTLGANESLIKEDRVTQKDQQSEQIACLVQVDETANMLMKKYKSKPPKCKEN